MPLKTRARALCHRKARIGPRRARARQPRTQRRPRPGGVVPQRRAAVDRGARRERPAPRPWPAAVGDASPVVVSPAARRRSARPPKRRRHARRSYHVGSWRRETKRSAGVARSAGSPSRRPPPTPRARGPSGSGRRPRRGVRRRSDRRRQKRRQRAYAGGKRTSGGLSVLVVSLRGPPAHHRAGHLRQQPGRLRPAQPRPGEGRDLRSGERASARQGRPGTRGRSGRGLHRTVPVSVRDRGAAQTPRDPVHCDVALRRGLARGAASRRRLGAQRVDPAGDRCRGRGRPTVESPRFQRMSFRRRSLAPLGAAGRLARIGKRHRGGRGVARRHRGARARSSSVSRSW